VKPRSAGAPGHTPDRRLEAVTEPPELGAMTRRVLASLVRRAGAGDLDALGELAALVDHVEYALALAAHNAHVGPAAYSWTEIARELGITRQAARQRFGGRHGP